MSGDESGSSDDADSDDDPHGAVDAGDEPPANESAGTPSGGSPAAGPPGDRNRAGRDDAGRPSAVGQTDESGDRGPVHHRGSTRESPPRRPGVRWWWRRFRTAQSGPLMIVREVLSSVALVAGIGLLLFAISGVWPPMVAVQSGSMEPHMHRGDLVFVVEENRFADDVAVEGTGVAPYANATNGDYEKFGSYGDVIIFEPDGSSLDVPIIHRAMFWVEEGENWYDRANPEYVRADNCEQLANCPAPNSGFITKGDKNPSYDQTGPRTGPVKPGWITGKAMVRVPVLGYIRLIFADVGHGVALALGAVAMGSGIGLHRRRAVP